MADEGTGATGQPKDFAFATLREGGQGVWLGTCMHRGLQARAWRCSKTWSIMSSGRAVLANFDEGELKEILENNGCGVFTKADDLDGFVAAIEELSQHPERCAEIGAKGREFILNNLTREVGTGKYVNVIKSFEKK